MSNCASRYSHRPANFSIHKFLIVNFVRQPLPLVFPLPQGLVQLPTNCCASALPSSQIRLLGSCLLPRPRLLRVYFLTSISSCFRRTIHLQHSPQFVPGIVFAALVFVYLIFVATAFWHSFWGRLAKLFWPYSISNFSLAFICVSACRDQSWY